MSTTKTFYPKTIFGAILSKIGFATATGKIAGGATLFSVNAGAPGSSFVTAIRLDTTGKTCYVWDGSAYVKIGEYA